jgi:NAD(P) transhydrogenase subunit alpha
MKLAIIKETAAHETRVAMTPDLVKKYVTAGYNITIESQAGLAAGYTDAAYQTAGAAIATSPVGNTITFPLICILPESLVGPFTITLLNPDRVATKTMRPYKSLTLNVDSLPTAV